MKIGHLSEVASNQKALEADGRTELDFDIPVKLEMKFAKCVGRTRFFGFNSKNKTELRAGAGFPAQFPVKIELENRLQLGFKFPNSIS